MLGFEPCAQRDERLRRVLAVGVDLADQLVVALERPREPGAVRAAEAALAGARQQVQPGPRLGQALHDRPGAVGRAVVHDQQLEVGPRRAEPLDERLDAGCFLVRGADHQAAHAPTIHTAAGILAPVTGRLVGDLRARIRRGKARFVPTSDPPLTTEDVVEVYRAMLGRPPENAEVIAFHVRNTPNVLSLVRGIGASAEFIRRTGVDVSTSSPFLFPNASVDVRGIIAEHTRADRQPRADHLVNFLGVAVPVKVMAHLRDRGGQLDEIPIPANHHADMAEWAAALRGVDLADGSFTMLELGCGWGCWMNNTGVAARARGLDPHLIGVEGDEKHLDLARETLAANGFTPAEYQLIRGVAAAGSGYALFPTQGEVDETWGSKPVFGLSADESAKAAATGQVRPAADGAAGGGDR